MFSKLFKYFFYNKDFPDLGKLDLPEANKKILKIINKNYILKKYYYDCYKINGGNGESDVSIRIWQNDFFEI